MSRAVTAGEVIRLTNGVEVGPDTFLSLEVDAGLLPP
jgi:hypothetical protein